MGADVVSVVGKWDQFVAARPGERSEARPGIADDLPRSIMLGTLGRETDDRRVQWPGEFSLRLPHHCRGIDEKAAAFPVTHSPQRTLRPRITSLAENDLEEADFP